MVSSSEIYSVGDIIVPKQEKRRIPTQHPDFESPTVNTYSVETTVAEKLDAILSLMEFSSRMKDYYDLYYIANVYYGENVPLFRRNGYRKSGTMILRVRSRDTALK